MTKSSFIVILLGLILSLSACSSEIDSIKEKKTEEVQTEVTQSIDQEKEAPEDKPVFVQQFVSTSINKEVEQRISGISWKESCPVSMDELAYVKVSYWGFDDQPHTGELIVHKALAQDMLDIFRELYEVKFPIEKIRLIDEYHAGDRKSMEDNNTSAFCFREVDGKPGKLSKHSYGAAIDINPIQNPYVYKDEISPEQGAQYLDRSLLQKGMITEGDACYKAFIDRGWIWGGDWTYEKDYQHFQKKL